jgi:hypothetical protein
VTAPSDAYTLRAVKMHTGTILSTILSDDFTNSNPSACPATNYELVDSEGNALDAAITAYVSINGDNKIEVDEASYPGGLDVSI